MRQLYWTLNIPRVLDQGVHKFILRSYEALAHLSSSATGGLSLLRLYPGVALCSPSREHIRSCQGARFILHTQSIAALA